MPRVVAQLLEDALIIEKFHCHPSAMDSLDMGRVWRALEAKLIVEAGERIQDAIERGKDPSELGIEYELFEELTTRGE